MKRQALPEFLTTTEIAKLLGLTTRRIQQLVQDGIITRDDTQSNKQRKFKSSEVIKQYIEYLTTKLEKENDDQNDEIIKLKKDKLKYEVDQKRTAAKLSKIKLNEYEGKMHSATDVENFTNDLVFTIRSALMSMPSRLAIDLAKENDPNIVREKIKQETNAILSDLSNYTYDPERYLEKLMQREGLESIDLDEE